jgi:hypothetical protein
MRITTIPAETTTNYVVVAVVVVVIFIIFVINFTQVIDNYIRETNHVLRVYSVEDVQQKN